MVKFPPTLTTLAEAVAYLLELSRARPMALIIDECQDLEGIAPNFWSQLQKVWGLGKNGEKLLLVMSGSLPSRLERIFGNRSEPQYGRSDVTLQPFSTETMRDVFALEGGDAGPGDFLLLYALIGGVARYVEYFVDNEAMTRKAMFSLLALFCFNSADAGSCRGRHVVAHDSVGGNRPADIFWTQPKVMVCP